MPILLNAAGDGLAWGETLEMKTNISPNNFGWWRSPVAHLYGVQVVAGSNPVHPTVSAGVLTTADIFVIDFFTMANALVNESGSSAAR